MTSHDKVARAFVAGEKATGSRMFTDGETVYSYGRHWHIATWVADGTILLNIDKKSSSTSKHEGYVRNAIPSFVRFLECSLAEIEEYLRNPDAPLIMYKKKQITDIDEAVEGLKRIAKNNGKKVFPTKKVKEAIYRTVNDLLFRTKERFHGFNFEVWYDHFHDQVAYIAFFKGKKYKVKTEGPAQALEDIRSSFSSFRKIVVEEYEFKIAEEV